MSRSRFFQILLLTIIFAVAWWLGREARNQNSNDNEVPRKQVFHRPVALPSPRAVSQEKKSESKEESCQLMMLQKFAGSCDNQCVLDAIEKKDPELFLYFEEGSLNSIEHAHPLKKKYKSKLMRFYLAEYFMLENDQSEKILSELAAEDKDNAFPALFQAVRLMYLQKPSQALKVFKEALNRKTYTHYVPDHRFRLLQLTIHDRKLFARALIMSTSDLQLSGPYQMDALEHLGEDLYHSLGKKLAGNAIRDGGKNANLLWSEADFEFGREIIGKQDPAEEAALEGLYETITRERDLYPVYAEEIDCDENAFMDYWEREKERLQSL